MQVNDEDEDEGREGENDGEHEAPTTPTPTPTTARGLPYQQRICRLVDKISPENPSPGENGIVYKPQSIPFIDYSGFCFEVDFTAEILRAARRRGSCGGGRRRRRSCLLAVRKRGVRPSAPALR